MADETRAQHRLLKDLRWPLRLTLWGMVSERVVRAFWPLWSILLLALALVMLGVHETAAVEVFWTTAMALVLGAVVSLWWGARHFVKPTRDEAMERLDATMPGRPLQTVLDDQAVGTGDAASMAVWRAHQARMAARAAEAKAVQPDLKLSDRDPFALRYVALLAAFVAILFGSIWRVGTVGDSLAPSALDVAGGPAWEGWVEPPGYTGLPTLYLGDITDETLNVAAGSRLTLRLYGEVGALTVDESISGRTEVTSAADPAQDFDIAQSGRLAIEGPGGRTWDIEVVTDAPPQIAVDGLADTTVRGEMSLPYVATDDYGVIEGRARIALDLAAVERRHGLTVDPEPRDAISTLLPMPITGDRSDFDETLIEDFSQHPFAHLPVTVQLSATDAAGNEGVSDPVAMDLPARRFFDPMAAAIIEQRRDLLWSRENAPRVAQILRAVSHRPDDIFRSETVYLKLRVTLRRLETLADYGLSEEARDEIAAVLWDLAILLEEGDITDALERLRAAQERLSEAMRNGASDQEIAELMQELREATQDYLRQLAQQQRQQSADDPDAQFQQSENMTQMTQDDLQAMMDRIQELMEQGRMAEAQQAMEELQQLLENMQVTQGQGGGQQSPGQQAMEGLAETLRDQQGLSDQAFRDLQERFNPGQQQGQQGQQGQGEAQNGQTPGMPQPGQNPGQGQGQGQAQGPSGQQPLPGGEQPGQGQGQGQGQGDQDLAGSLADRQEALRRELERQRQGLPGSGTAEGQAAREALERADRAMRGAEDALRADDLAEAIDQQSEAMDALREGIRSLGEAMAQAQQEGQGQQGLAEGQTGAQERDPLGRNTGSNGSIGTEENLLQGEDVYRRARDLLDEIRRRSGEGARPEMERDYLRRLLDRF